MELTKVILENQAEHITNNQNETILFLLAKHNDSDAMKLLLERVDDINEKMYDFEANKRNNLIFYGIPNEARETHSMLQQKVPQHQVTCSLKN